jgi:hypothetical protein
MQWDNSYYQNSLDPFFLNDDENQSFLTSLSNDHLNINSNNSLNLNLNLNLNWNLENLTSSSVFAKILNENDIQNNNNNNDDDNSLLIDQLESSDNSPLSSISSTNNNYDLSLIDDLQLNNFTYENISDFFNINNELSKFISYPLNTTNYSPILKSQKNLSINNSKNEIEYSINSNNDLNDQDKEQELEPYQDQRQEQEQDQEEEQEQDQDQEQDHEIDEKILNTLHLHPNAKSTKKISDSRLSLSQLSIVLNLEGNDEETAKREKNILNILKNDLNFPIGEKTWIRDTPSIERECIINKLTELVEQYYNYGYSKKTLSIIVRRASYYMMQGRLRRERRLQRKRKSMSHQKD